MGVSGAVSAPGTSSLPRHRKLDLTRWCLVPQLLPASCTRFCPTHQIHASLYSSISNRELWHKDIRLRQKASWEFMRWGPTTGQCQAQGAMLWIIVRPSCQVPEGEQKGILFYFFFCGLLSYVQGKTQGTREASTCRSCWSQTGSRSPPRLLLLQHCCLCWHFLSPLGMFAWHFAHKTCQDDARWKNDITFIKGKFKA